MKKVNKHLISSFLFLMVLFLLIGCSKKSHYECEYKYDGSIYSESYDYKNNYGYEYFLDKNTNQAKLYEDTYLRSVDFSNKELNLNKKKKKDFALFFKAECKTYSLTINEIRQVFDIFVYENPMFYFISEINYELSSDYVNLEISKDYYQYDDRVRYNNLIDEGIKLFEEKIKTIDGEFDRIKYIYDYIEDNMTYYDEDDGSLYWAHNIIGFFDNKEGVCETYTKTFCLFCQMANIECIPVYSVEHVWNMAKVYDMWYIFDLTADCFGYSSELYFMYEYEKDRRYDDVMIDVPNTPVSSLCFGEMILYEDENEIHRSHSIDDICRFFNGGKYELVLDAKSIVKTFDKGKDFYINELSDNYEFLKIVSNSYEIVTIINAMEEEEKYIQNDTYLYLVKDLYIKKDTTFEKVNYKTHISLYGATEPMIKVSYEPTITVYRGFDNRSLPIGNYGYNEPTIIYIDDRLD